MFARLLLAALYALAPDTFTMPARSGHVAEAYQAIEDLAPAGLQSELKRTCRRESWCNRWGQYKAHPNDAKHGASMHAAAMKRGKLDPDCPEHALEPASQWAPGGTYGMSPTLYVGLLGDCVGTAHVGEPRHDTRAALAYFGHLRRVGLATSCYGRVRRWAGARKWDRRSRVLGMRKASRICLDLGAHQWIEAVWLDATQPRVSFTSEAARTMKAWN